MATNATTVEETDESNEQAHAPLWTYGQAAAQRAEEATETCEHEKAIENDGEILCWQCFKADLEHFDVGESDE